MHTGIAKYLYLVGNEKSIVIFYFSSKKLFALRRVELKILASLEIRDLK